MLTLASRVQESLQPSEWLAVALAAAGTIGLGATTEEAPKGSAVSVVRAVAVVSVLVVALGEALLSLCICTWSLAWLWQRHDAVVQTPLLNLQVQDQRCG
jgi:hypothetical protein